MNQQQEAAIAALAASIVAESKRPLNQHEAAAASLAASIEKAVLAFENSRVAEEEEDGTTLRKNINPPEGATTNVAEEESTSSKNSNAAEVEAGTSLSKKAAKKEALKQEKRKRQEKAAAAAAALAAASTEEADPLSGNYVGNPLEYLEPESTWTEIEAVDETLKDQTVLISGRIKKTCRVGKQTGFLVVEENDFTIQCVLTVAENQVSEQMVKFATGLSKESIVDIQGIVSVPGAPIRGATQQVELQVRKICAVSKAVPMLPLNIEDAARSEADIENALEAGVHLPRVTQDTRLNNRVLDLRTPANQAIFRIESEVGKLFRQHLYSAKFIEIFPPRLLSGSSEGGASVFTLDYNGRPACLAQSPQLHKQMAICANMKRVFVTGPVYRAEKSNTHRHLCEFNGLDAEMVIKKHYSEVMDLVDALFVAMFDGLNENCKKELKAVRKQYPFEPLKYLRKTLRLTFEEGIQMLKEEDGVEVDPLSDLNTEMERKLGKLVAEKYGTDFFILYKFPLAVRPFYTMPAYDNPEYSNSFDVFLRGEEIISGAQRIHDPELLTARAQELGINLETLEAYMDAFRYGTSPHGGFGVGLERVVMLFCGLDNIRKTSLFPRDPQRLTP
ncbi:hypothetical protein MKW94_027247 [Papaver nudicaule]|uniref:aspartate--tRNA ligase n=1 Tax=Papaver nudicaule TaxID=74823 RepID=A0AA42B2M8_PAPNU|nr:hypothetical protein [Papaver nudicaule]